MSQTSSSPVVRALAAVLGVVIAVAGLVLAVGGVRLLTLGGSAYFVLMGVAMLASGVLLVRRRPAGVTLYLLALLATAVWAVFDAGWHFWPLVSRLAMPLGFGLLALLVLPTLKAAQGGGGGRGAYAGAALLALVFVAGFVHAFRVEPVVAPTSEPAVMPVAAGKAQKNWESWGNTTAGTRFAALDQINKQNVGQLQVAWTAHTGDVPDSNGFGAEDQDTPLQIGDTLYICTAHNRVVALDADSGATRWSYDSKATAPNWQRCRGLGYYADADNGSATRDAECAQRILMTTVDARLIALDAKSGKPCTDFGDAGTVDLKAGMGEVKPGFYTLTAAPLVAGDLIVVGGRVADNIEVNEPSGVVRAFDVHSGKLVWAWDLSKEKPDTPLDPNINYTRATPNVWTSMAYDAKLGLIYLPTGNTTPDQWGGERTPQDDKYNSAVVALDVKTGTERWLFQTVRHDLWDYDLPAQPALIDLPDGTPALAQVTKAGQIFLLNRQTGEPITKVEDIPAPQGNASGERYAKTQPVSTGLPQIGTERLTESDMWGATPFDQLACRIQFKQMRYDGLFTPPGEDMALQWPGSLGGMNWGSVAYDPTNHYLFVNDMRLGLWTRLIPRAQMQSGAGGVEMGAASQTGTPYGSLRNRFLSPLGIPCQKPPYGTMSAVDLTTGKLAWQVPVGTVEDTGPLGIKMHMGIPIGMPTLGPSLATQSGLLFFAGTQDYYLRAFDSGSGREVWKARLPVGSQGGPMTYVSPKTGRQYIVVTAGGARQSPDRGDYVVAYALPKPN
ncbi:membrane-bound PQQ-dependent dehydrogenase, glucose/quinate/shikimate family [Solimonas marina]|uniref:Membrane-bound PQQ-dependent dehydrogenase, glucose/quinate/shikimate family n=1 Tax=Solimonas marina TaxID=2714601 RepID=A0A969WCM8_9GAMM|nr:membrane-bound PQQ-dependent dehydrogenase, glucose/quinate/shikimate family [Solimonas marina]NKF23764.1 membrane-bound PQQ-dependent dehydrogenase, glucose/quinate/shikimate family [Solimonas marina]